MKRIPAVIVKAERQAEAVDALVAYCEKLDGTKITVLDAPPGPLTYPEGNTAALHQAAAHFKNQPFCWLEPDSIPLASGWLKGLSREYVSAGKPFMLSSDSNPPYDLIGGIGIYGPQTDAIIPRSFEKDGWDKWLIDTIPHAVHRTPLIQHSYGIYNSNLESLSAPHRFPRDSNILRPESLIFHRDVFQDLLKPPEEGRTFRHSGDIGDIIAALPILRHIGGGRVILCENLAAPPGQHSRESLKGKRYEAIKPLLEAQPYVSSVEWEDVIDPNPNFRGIMRPRFESLTERQARHSGHWPVDVSPWLTPGGRVDPHDRVICCRSPRYHNPFGFPWRDIADTYGSRLLFIGLPDEHTAFEAMLGRKVAHAKTPDFLEIAKLMAGAPQVVANQSSPLWVALGLGCKLICEGDPRVPNSQLPRPGSFWAYEPQHMEVLRRSFARVRAQRK